MSRSRIVPSIQPACVSIGTLSRISTSPRLVSVLRSLSLTGDSFNRFPLTSRSVHRRAIARSRSKSAKGFGCQSLDFRKHEDSDSFQTRSDLFQTTEGFFKYADLSCLTAGHDLQHRSARADGGRSHLSGYRREGPSSGTTMPLVDTGKSGSRLNAQGSPCVRYASRRHLDRVGILYICRSNKGFSPASTDE